LGGVDSDGEDQERDALFAGLGRRESFTEGSVLFGDDDEEDFDGGSTLLFSQATSTTGNLNTSLLSSVATVMERQPLYPPEPPLPSKVKDAKWLRVAASCVVVSSNGVQYALSQFMPHLKHLGQNTVASAISLFICSFTLGCIFHGSFLMKYVEGPRVSVLLTSPLVLALLLSTAALRGDEAWLLQLSFALTGFGVGPSFLSAIIHMQFWLPKSPALASSIGMAFGGLGSVAMATMIEVCIDKYGIYSSLTILSLTLFGLQAGGGLFLKMPDLSSGHTKDLLVSHRSKLDSSTRSGLGIELTAGEIVKSSEFALFWVSAFTAVGPGYALFANLGGIFTTSLGMPKRVAANWVILVNLIATIFGRLPAGYIADRWNMSQWKIFGSGSRSLFLLFHCVQMAGLLASAFVTDEYLSLFLITVIVVIFGGCNVLIAALSRELFAPINSGQVYGLILTSTAASALVFPNLLPFLNKLTGENFFYNILACLISCVGAVCCLLLKPLPKAFKQL